MDDPVQLVLARDLAALDRVAHESCRESSVQKALSTSLSNYLRDVVDGGGYLAICGEHSLICYLSFAYEVYCFRREENNLKHYVNNNRLNIIA